MNDYLIAIDIGTTSAKSLSITPDGKILCSHQRFYSTSFSQDGHAEQDPELIFKSVVDLISSSVVSSAHCLGVSFSAAMHSLTAIDKNNQPILPLLIWSDTRSRKQSQKIIESSLAQKFYEITGTPVHPMSPLCKLAWLKENTPDVYHQAHKFLSIKEYVLYQLTGQFVIDHSIASATGLFDLEKLNWSDDVIRYLSLGNEKLSTPVPVSTSLPLKAEYAKILGVDRKTPLIIGASDGCLAQWGSDALDDDDLTITIGTSGAVRVASSSRKIDPDGKVFNYILNDEKFICGGATNCGSALLTWFRNAIDKSASEDIKEFAEQANQVPPGCEGMICVPFLLGERSPVYNAEASGIFWGVKMNHTKIHFQRALLEGICFEIKWILETVEKLYGRKGKIIVSGGINRSPAWLQLLCDVLGREILVDTGVEASALGAAKLGFKSLNINLKMPSKNPTTFQPDMHSRSLYEKHFETFKQIYDRLKDLKLENN